MPKGPKNCGLSSLVIDGLKCLDCSLPEYVLRNILTYCAKVVMNPSEVIPSLPESHKQNIKNLSHVIYAVSTLYIVSVQNNLDRSLFKELIKSAQLSSNVIDTLSEIYDNYHKDLAEFQTLLGPSLNRVDDLDWRISVDTNNSTTDMIPELNFHITMYHYNSNTGDKSTAAEFICNTEEMQLLIHKLKSLERHCNKFAAD